MPAVINQDRRSIRSVLFHALVISGIMSFEIAVVKLTGVPLGIPYFLPYYLPDIILFYVNVYLTMRILDTNWKWTLVLLILTELLFHFIIYVWIDKQINEHFSIPTTRVHYVRAGYRGLYIFLLSMAYWIVLRNKRQAKEIFDLKLQALELQNRQVILENAYLRAQANPHLTFNTLNALYSTLESKSPEEANAVKLLSDTMDYAMGRAGEDGKHSLEHEIVQVDKRIALYQFLSRNRYQINFTASILSGEDEPRMPPLILVSLVDNIFMHGNLLDENHPAIIVVSCKNNMLHCTMSNLVANQRRRSHGLGLEFVQRCLAFYYSGRFNLQTTTEDGIYTLNLSIEL